MTHLAKLHIANIEKFENIIQLLAKIALRDNYVK